MCRSTGSARAAACGCSPTPRSPRWSRPPPNATSNSACSPARAAPGTSAARCGPTRGGRTARPGPRRGRRLRRGRRPGHRAGRQVPARRRRGRAVDTAPGPRGRDRPGRHHAEGLGAHRPGQPGLVRRVRAARRRLRQRAQRSDAGPPHRDPQGVRRPHGHVHRGPRRPRRLRPDVRGRRADPARRAALPEVRPVQGARHLPVGHPSAGRDPGHRPGAGAARPARPGPARPARRGRRHGAARLPACRGLCTGSPSKPPRPSPPTPLHSAPLHDENDKD